MICILSKITEGAKISNRNTQFHKFLLMIEGLLHRFYGLWKPILGLILFVVLSLLYFYREDTITDDNILNSLSNQVVSLSGIFSAIIIGFVSAFSIQIRREKLERKREVRDFTQKVLAVRSILYRVFYLSNIWKEDVPSYVRSRYKKLTFFEIRDYIFANSLRLKESQIQEFSKDPKYGSLKRLYLDLESIVNNRQFDPLLFYEYEYEVYLESDYIFLWLKYESGVTLCQIFGEYKTYESFFDFERIDDENKFEIKRIALRIDRSRYSDMEINADFLYMLGDQFHESLVPNLYRLQIQNEEDLPSIVRYLYLILSLLLIIGVIFPVVVKLFLLPINLLVISIIGVLAIGIYILTSFYSIVNEQMKV